MAEQDTLNSSSLDSLGLPVLDSGSSVDSLGLPTLDSSSSVDSLGLPVLGDSLSVDKPITTATTSLKRRSVSDPDSFGNVLSRSFNESYNSFLDFTGVLGRQINSESLVEWSEEQQEETRRDIAALGTPTRTASITGGIDEIDEAYEKEGLGAAFSRGGLLLKDMVATALGSAGIPIATTALAIPVAAAGAPAVVTGSVALLGPFIAGAMIGGSVEEEAKARGATQEEADKAALISAPIGAVLERFGAGKIVRDLVGKFGKDAIIAEAGKELGEEVAEKAVNRALQFTKGVVKTGKKVGKVGKDVAKAGGKGIVREAPIELGQEVLTQAAAQKAAGQDIDLDVNRMIDAAALGGIAGFTISGSVKGLSKISERNAIVEAQEVEKELETLKKNNENFEEELSTPVTRGVLRADEKIKGPEDLSAIGKVGEFLGRSVRRSTTQLRNLARKNTRGAEVVGALSNYFNDVHTRIGQLHQAKEKVIDTSSETEGSARKRIKAPFTKSISKELNNEVFDNLQYGTRSTNETANRMADGFRENVLNPVFNMLKDSGVNIEYRNDYLPRLYKLSSSKNRKKFEKVLIESGVSKKQSEGIIENIHDNGGVFIPQAGAIDLFSALPEKAGDPISETKISEEQARGIPTAIFKKLDEAGLVDRDVNKILNRYITRASNRAKQKELQRDYLPVLKELQDEGVLSQQEKTVIKKISDAILGRQNVTYRQYFAPFYKPFLTLQYIATLPFAAITALAEPAVVLYKASPKNAIFGLANASYVGFRKTLRTIFPRLPKTKLEESLNSLYQTADLALVDALRDIDSISVSEKVTNAFFRANFLAQVTQFSRYIAYDASKRQIRDDLKTIENAQGKKTRATTQARRRLLEQGLVEPESEVLQDWGSGKLEQDPKIIQQALAKTVDEIIQSPNVVNRPLWMSNPYLAPVAQLKGFMLVFGNTVGGALLRDVAKPLARGRIPIGEGMKYLLMFSMIMSVMFGTQALKDSIRYGDDESPFDKKDGFEKFKDLLVATNIFGWGGLVNQALEAKEFGSSPLVSLAGPAASSIDELVNAIGNLNAFDALFKEEDLRPRALATWIAKNFTPFLGNIPEFRERVRDIIKPD